MVGSVNKTTVINSQHTKYFNEINYNFKCCEFVIVLFILPTTWCEPLSHFTNEESKAQKD